MDIIIVGQQPWDTEIGCNSKNIALEFSQGNRVLYVNAPLDRITKIREKQDEKIAKRIAVINGGKDGLEVLQDNLWTLYPDVLIESINWIKLTGIYNLINRWNNKLFANSIKKAIKILGFKDYVLFNDSDMFRSFYLDELLQPELTVYYSRDYFQANEYYKYHGSRLEPELIRKTDLCVANSPFLVNFCKQYNKEAYYVGQGCDLDLFTRADKGQVPADIAAISGPIVGYVGAIVSARLDIEVIGYIAETNPEWQLVLVGPEDDVFQESMLHQMPNVHFLGAKKPEDLPFYINCFDVCINPQILNDFTRGNYPRKIDEYLVLGKPVVATQTEAMVLFKDFTYLAETKQDYVALISRALHEDTKETQDLRKSFALEHSWFNSVKAIYEAIKRVSANKLDEAKVIEFRSFML